MDSLDKHLQDIGSHAQEHSIYSLFVPLYLVVLAFFIVLTSVSSKDEARVEGAVTSIIKVFADEYGKSLKKTDIKQLLTYDDIANIYFSKIEKSAKEHLNLQEIDSVRRGNSLQVSFPSKVFFPPSSSDIKMNAAAFMSDMSDLLKENLKIATLVVTMTIDNNFSKINQGEVLVSRSWSLMDHLMKSYVDQERLSGGISFAGRDKVIMKFEMKSNNLKEAESEQSE